MFAQHCPSSRYRQLRLACCQRPWQHGGSRYMASFFRINYYSPTPMPLNRWSITQATKQFGLKCLLRVPVQHRTLTCSAEALLERARKQSCDLGFDPGEVYEPWLPTDVCQQGILALYGITGEATLSLVIFALLLRVSTLPLNLRSLQRQCDKIDMMPVYVGLVKEFQEAQARRGGKMISSPSAGAVAQAAEKAEADLQLATQKMHDFSTSTKFSPVQGMGYTIFCLMPKYILAYCTMRGMIAHPDAFRNFAVEPSLWLDSLLLTDPLGVLPLISACAVLLNAEINSPPVRDGQEENAVYFKFVIYGAVLTFVPLTSMLSSGMLVFMATNATYTAIITWIYRRYWWVPPRLESRWLAVAKNKT